MDRQGKKLDAAYIRRWLKDFSDVLANGDILERFETAWKNR